MLFINYDTLFNRFYIVWEHDEPEKWTFYVLLYFMADDRILIYDSKDKSHNKNRNLFPTLLGKIKLPKDWTHLPCKYYFIYIYNIILFYNYLINVTYTYRL